MIDPILSLSFAIHSNKGVYALLLGSGASRSAGIPTGWEVVLDLVRKLAAMQGKDCEPDPPAWYKNEFGKEADYSQLLNTLTSSPSERNGLLKSYFEPSEDEREQGLKSPTQTHRAVAELVVSGYIRVILTTNFDRLLEEAIVAKGIVPTVISTPDAAEGALPLVHTSCTIIKVHGDYLDTRIKNTPDELAQYDQRIDTLLDRVLDEYGLIVCGWSADWDLALRGAIERCKGHRFATFWAARGQPSQKAQNLINHRKAQVISISNSDHFFQELAEKVLALAEYSQPHPLSSKLAIATLKKYLVDERNRIRLHDFVMQETEKIYNELLENSFPIKDLLFANNDESALEFNNRILRYEALTETLQAIFINGCYWGEKQQIHLWIKSLERIARQPAVRGRIATTFLDLRMYPALLLLYAGGIAAVAAEKYNTFASLLTDVKVQDPIYDVESFAVQAIYPNGVIKKDFLTDKNNTYTPVNTHLFETLRAPFKELIPSQRDYEMCFDKFEYLFALIYVDTNPENQEKIQNGWGPVGRFGWRCRRTNDNIIREVQTEFADKRQEWKLLKTGLFSNSAERFENVSKAFWESSVNNSRWR